jgi:hypothetical protein
MLEKKTEEIPIFSFGSREYGDSFSANLSCFLNYDTRFPMIDRSGYSLKDYFLQGVTSRKVRLLFRREFFQANSENSRTSSEPIRTKFWPWISLQNLSFLLNGDIYASISLNSVEVCLPPALQISLSAGTPILEKS